MVSPIKISRKCRYALRAIFELANRDTDQPVKIHNIASSQAIPPRFLEVILSELKHGGFVESRRGSDGGYILAKSANKLTVGEILAFLWKGSSNKENDRDKANVLGYFAFMEMYKNINVAISNIYDNTTFADLVEKEHILRGEYIPNYNI